MAVYPLAPYKKGSNTMYPHSSTYTEEYAQRICGWYLTNHYSADEKGQTQVRYRLHSCKARTFSDFMTKDIIRIYTWLPIPKRHKKDTSQGKE